MSGKLKFLIALLIIVSIGWYIFWLYDYHKDYATKTDGDLYKTIVKRGYLIAGVKTDSKPFGFIDSKGENVGFDIDIARHIAKEILHDPQKVKFVPLTDTERLYKLNLNEVDMVIATMSITPSRQNYADFSNAYYITGQALLVMNGSNIRSLADLSNKNVGVIFGSTAEDTIKFLLPTAHVFGYKTYNDAYKALKNRTVQGITSDEAILRNYSLSDSSVKLLPKRYSRDSYGIALRRGTESDYMLEIINHLISDMDARGILNQLKHKWGLN